ncbi:MAG TPA: hypothetical protein VFC19_00940 [Candidatus Limnocylindrales bacterium]|nr:hypothetical protein [Candidatus Limnocylindrales bacterium]
MADVHVEPQQLAYTADDFKSCSAAVSAICGNVTTAPQAQAFGQLPQSKALADALNACVKLTADDLGAAVYAAERIYSGLNVCARGYTDTDSDIAGTMTRVA